MDEGHVPKEGEVASNTFTVDGEKLREMDRSISKMRKALRRAYRLSKKMARSMKKMTRLVARMRERSERRF